MHSPKRIRKTKPVVTFYAYTDEEARVYANAHRTSANVFAFYNALHDYSGDEIDG